MNTPRRGPDGLDPDQANLRAVPGYRAIVDYLHREIALGQLRPGDRLPPERRLAEQLGVARETLRQALRILEGSGQIVVRRGAKGGAFVQESILNPERIREEARERADEIRHLAEFRTVIEAGAARLAAERRTEADLVRMEQAQADLSSAESVHDSRRADTDFHLAVAAAAGNPALASAIADARVRMLSPIDLLSYRFEKHSTCQAHAQVLHAIRDGDIELAATAMTSHLANTVREFELLVREVSTPTT
ncbi:FadR/GntR family transcriptional regulator [Rhodococcus qingshengii]|uniref:FadR/GntR family transcriptional regulator n=1 Tax=Rhodococcus qingshengii TaxID=334542 RepID=UPI0036DB994E